MDIRVFVVDEGVNLLAGVDILGCHSEVICFREILSHSFLSDKGGCTSVVACG